MIFMYCITLLHEVRILQEQIPQLAVTPIDLLATLYFVFL